MGIVILMMHFLRKMKKETFTKSLVNGRKAGNYIYLAFKILYLKGGVMNNTTGTITGVKKLIILDAKNGVVVILPVTTEEQVEAWCDQNQTNLGSCAWMVWDGYVRYGE